MIYVPELLGVSCRELRHSMWPRGSSGGVPSEKAGVEAVSGRAQVQMAEMGEVIRSMEGREFKRDTASTCMVCDT